MNLIVRFFKALADDFKFGPVLPPEPCRKCRADYVCPDHRPEADVFN